MDYMMDLRPYLTPNPYTIEPVSNVPLVNWIDSMILDRVVAPCVLIKLNMP